MTFEGRNWDVLTGLTALPVAWLVAKNRAPKWLIYAWNIGGLALLFKCGYGCCAVHADSAAAFSKRACKHVHLVFSVRVAANVSRASGVAEHILIFRAAKERA